MMNPADLKELLPSYYDDVREMQILMDVENEGVKQAANATQRVKDNFYIQTAHEEVISYYERFYGINTKVDDTMQQRRFRVLVRMTSRPPYTKRYLQEQLEMLGTTAKITQRPQEYQVEVVTSLGGRGEVDELPYLFRKMVPYNMVVISKNRLENTGKAMQNVGGVARSWTTITTR